MAQEATLGCSTLQALTSWRLHLFPLKVPAKVSQAEEGRGVLPVMLPASLVTGLSTPPAPHQVESSFNVLEIRAFSTLSQNQVSTRAQASSGPGGRSRNLRLCCPPPLLRSWWRLSVAW